MANIIKACQFSMNDTAGLIKPIIICSSSAEIEDKASSISVSLSRKLSKCGSPMMRAMKMENCLLDVMNGIGDSPIIKDIDVMFNPEYQIDVIRILISASKKKDFIVVWPGQYEDGKLFYAEEGYRDYKNFDVNNYDITVVI